MVASTTSPRSTASVPGGPEAPISALNKCRYKTGKCMNARSRKRNGQPHQLCLFHRDKANQIQRKFDRQKRHVARSKKASETQPRLTVPPALSMRDMAALAGLTPVSAGTTYSMSSPSSTASFSRTKVQMHTPASVDCPLNDGLWTTATISLEYQSVHMRYYQSYLSMDEIDFLCSAILE
ncbi:hypothetical protein PsorP6_007230 [Peronosclerospora sorghi]|uniref:Uncharacterized protein n=1 Tax=Peronosclerospora sorghi TaxID=230839 RepID=A0ACC0WA12_9STRA|nr:hypothetical protein PsorP6_007230 [Peronosclerospora sorghi]